MNPEEQLAMLEQTTNLKNQVGMINNEMSSLITNVQYLSQKCETEQDPEAKAKLKQQLDDSMGILLALQSTSTKIMQKLESFDLESFEIENSTPNTQAGVVNPTSETEEDALKKLSEMEQNLEEMRILKEIQEMEQEKAMLEKILAHRQEQRSQLIENPGKITHHQKSDFSEPEPEPVP